MFSLSSVLANSVSVCQSVCLSVCLFLVQLARRPPAQPFLLRHSRASGSASFSSSETFSVPARQYSLFRRCLQIVCLSLSPSLRARARAYVHVCVCECVCVCVCVCVCACVRVCWGVGGGGGCRPQSSLIWVSSLQQLFPPHHYCCSRHCSSPPLCLLFIVTWAGLA